MLHELIDFLLATNIVLSGNNYAKVALLFRFMYLGMISASQFDRVQSLYIVPTVMEYWNATLPSSNYKVTRRLAAEVPCVVVTQLCWSFHHLSIQEGSRRERERQANF